MLSGLIRLIILILQMQYLHGSMCNGKTFTLEATAVIQSLVSPNYPNRYPDSELCRWVVKATQPTDVIRFMVTDLKIEKSTTCSEDSVEIRDGQHHWNRLMRRWCGDEIPAGNTTSSSDAIFIKFRSDSAGGDSGFRILFWTVPKEFDRYSDPVFTSVNFVLFAFTGLVVAVVAGGIATSALVHWYQRARKARTAPTLKTNEPIQTNR